MIVVTSSNPSGMDDAQHRALLASWRATPGVLSAGDGGSTPASMMINVRNLRQAGPAGDGVTIQLDRMGPDAFQTFGVGLIAGRLPDRAHSEDFPAISPPNPPTAA